MANGLKSDALPAANWSSRSGKLRSPTIWQVRSAGMGRMIGIISTLTVMYCVVMALMLTCYYVMLGLCLVVVNALINYNIQRIYNSGSIHSITCTLS